MRTPPKVDVTLCIPYAFLLRWWRKGIALTVWTTTFVAAMAMGVIAGRALQLAL